MRRGCTFDEDFETEWCREGDGCDLCMGSGCNTQNSRYHSCLRCESDMNGDCAAFQRLDQHTQMCDFGSSYPFSKRGCFTNVKGILMLFMQILIRLRTFATNHNLFYSFRRKNNARVYR